MAFSRARALLRGEDGFSVLESTVALVIVFGVLLTMMRTLDTSLRVLVETRRQAAASAFANELIERARSLEWENTGLTADSNDDDCPGQGDGVDGVGCPEWASLLDVDVHGTTGQYTFEGEHIVFVNPTQTFDPFLSFHEEVTRDNTTFHRYLFVTSIRDDQADATTERYRKLTAIVRWTPPGGFPKEVRQVTYVARFREPSIPYLKGSVVFDGGHLTVRGNEADGRGFVQGTERWAVGGSARPDLLGTVELPDVKVNATTDYVSGAEVVATGVVGEYDWSDGTGHLVGPDRFEKLADDDFGSLPPLNDSWSSTDLPAWKINESFPYDYLAREEVDNADPFASPFDSVLDPTTVGGEAWTEHSGDDLPYARMELRSAEAVATWFAEYSDDVESALGVSLTGNPYAFTLLWHGAASGDTLSYDATVDRVFPADDPNNRHVTVTATWEGETVYLGLDDVYLLEDNDFRGWIRILLPRIEATLGAGESGTVSSPVISSGNLEIAYWDPVGARYVTVFNDDYDDVTSVVTIDIDSAANDGTYDPTSPLTHSIGTAGLPDVSYRVSALLTINPQVRSYSENGDFDIVEAVAQVPTIVAGEMRYHVQDDTQAALGDGRIFDVVLDFGLGGFDANARYLDPEAS